MEMLHLPAESILQMNISMKLNVLDTDEVALLLDFVESAGEHLTGQALNYYKKTRDRDIAILTLLLGTGIRVSECVGLDIKENAGIFNHTQGWGVIAETLMGNGDRAYEYCKAALPASYNDRAEIS